MLNTKKAKQKIYLKITEAYPIIIEMVLKSSLFYFVSLIST